MKNEKIEKRIKIGIWMGLESFKESKDEVQNQFGNRVNITLSKNRLIIGRDNGFIQNYKR